MGSEEYEFVDRQNFTVPFLVVNMFSNSVDPHQNTCSSGKVHCARIFFCTKSSFSTIPFLGLSNFTTTRFNHLPADNISAQKNCQSKPIRNEMKTKQLIVCLWECDENSNRKILAKNREKERVTSREFTQIARNSRISLREHFHDNNIPFTCANVNQISWLHFQSTSGTIFKCSRLSRNPRSSVCRFLSCLFAACLQMIPNTGMLVGQQGSNGVQLILKSPSPQSISTSVPKAQVVVSSNSSLTQSPNTVFVQASRTQPQQVSGRKNGKLSGWYRLGGLRTNVRGWGAENCIFNSDRLDTSMRVNYLWDETTMIVSMKMYPCIVWGRNSTDNNVQILEQVSHCCPKNVSGNCVSLVIYQNRIPIWGVSNHDST